MGAKGGFQSQREGIGGIILVAPRRKALPNALRGREAPLKKAKAFPVNFDCRADSFLIDKVTCVNSRTQHTFTTPLWGVSCDDATGIFRLLVLLIRCRAQRRGSAPFRGRPPGCEMRLRGGRLCRLTAPKSWISFPILAPSVIRRQ